MTKSNLFSASLLCGWMTMSSARQYGAGDYVEAEQKSGVDDAKTNFLYVLSQI
jgi:hypothetical protein